MSADGKSQEPRPGEISPEEREAFRKRSEDIGKQLDSAQAQRKAVEEAQDKAANAKGMALGMRLSSEFVAAIVIGGLIGYGLDQWLGTKPWLFLLFFMLGLAAAILTVTRAFNRLQNEIKRETKGNIGSALPDDEDD